MKYINIFILAIFINLSPLAASAHGAGGHGGGPALTQTDAIEFAKYRAKILVENGKIEKSWSPAIVESAEQQTNGHETEWVVTFKNSKASNPAKNILYIFLTTKGEFIAANFTGK